MSTTQENQGPNGMGGITCRWLSAEGALVYRRFQVRHNEDKKDIIKLLQWASYSGTHMEIIPRWLEVAEIEELAQKQAV